MIPLPEMFEFAFMQRALMAATVVGIVCSLVAFFVVLKGLSFIGVGIAHSAFGGIAVGLIAGTDPLMTTLLFTTLVAWAIGLTSRGGEIREDVAIGIFFSAAMALGVALISFIDDLYVDLWSFLFGNILAVTPGDLWFLTVVGLIVVAFVVLFFKELLFLTFDEEVAEASGLPTSLLYFGLLTALSLTVVVAVKVVGIILVAALLVIPGAIGYELSKHYRWMILLSVIAGLTATSGGLIASYRWDLPSGASIVLIAALLFFLSLLFSPRRKLLEGVRLRINRIFGRESGNRRREPSQ